MGDEPVVLIDLNIILDVLQKREPFYDTSAQVLAGVEIGVMTGYLAAHSVTTLYYLIQKDQSSAAARAAITELLQFLQIAPVNQSTIEQALNLDYQDFEDAVQMISALQCKADYLNTRNISDYQPPLVPVLKPVDLLALIE
ncbi:MAG: PIN domain-containing protein [Anaerolineales bacterium]